MGTAQPAILSKGQCWRSNHLSGDRHVSLSTPWQISPVLREGGREDQVPPTPASLSRTSSEEASLTLDGHIC